ncbi:MAG: hypothetical protein EXQ58_07775 [Acidobacteria bacterium]|nr:hypothetical protein [Acidobacteriota bacterium]
MSTKSTKEEMLKAYNELANRYQEKSATVSERQVEAKRTADATVLEKASNYTVESIIKGLAELNIYVVSVRWFMLAEELGIALN